MLFHRQLLSFLVLLAIPAGVVSRRGHSDSDSDSGSDSGDYSSSSSSSSSGSTSSCVENGLLTVSDIQPFHYWNYTFVFGDPDAYTDWNGIYFNGAASFDYEIHNLPKILSTHGASCPAGQQSIRMLGVAWVGPRTPYPTGLINPFSLGFKAWQSDEPVSNITYSYKFCEADIDLVHLGTTVDWSEWNWRTQEDIHGSTDAVVLNLTQAAGNSHEILFDGVYDLTGLRESQMVSANDGVRDDQIVLPAQTCSLLGEVLIGWPTGTYINGSMTNETLALDISGSTVAGFGELYGTSEAKVNVSFHISFTGSYDSANSSQVLNLGQSGQSLVSFEKATEGAAASIVAPRFLMMVSLMMTSGMAWI